MTFYATSNAEALADELWSGFTNTSANSTHESEKTARTETRKPR